MRKGSPLVKFFIDNNLPIPLAKALNELSQPKGYSVLHLKDKFAEDIPDHQWINKLAEEENWIIISQDHMKKGNLEKEALRKCRLTAFFLTKQWNDHKYWDKAHQLVRWWPLTIEQSELITGGAVFRVPWRISGKGKFEQVKI